MKHLLLIFLMSACTHQMVKREPVPEVILHPTITKSVKVIRATPKYVLGKGATAEYLEAVDLVNAYANTDEFWDYVESQRTGEKNYFAHTTLSVKEAIAQFRSELAKGETIQVEFFTPWYKSAQIGAWDGTRILENTQKHYTSIKRAGHLLHETSHKYGFVHSGNYPDKNDNQNSFPYVVGYALEEFVSLRVTQLAQQ